MSLSRVAKFKYSVITLIRPPTHTHDISLLSLFYSYFTALFSHSIIFLNCFQISLPKPALNIILPTTRFCASKYISCPLITHLIPATLHSMSLKPPASLKGMQGTTGDPKESQIICAHQLCVSGDCCW